MWACIYNTLKWPERCIFCRGVGVHALHARLWECVCHCTYRVICGKLVYGLVCSDADLGLRAKLCTDSPWQLTYRDCGLYSTYWQTAYRTYRRGSSQADLLKLFIKYILHTGFKFTQVFWKQVCEVVTPRFKRCSTQGHMMVMKDHP